MTQRDDADAFLMGGEKLPSISWKNKAAGHTVTGVIDRPSKVVQQRDIDSGDLLWWDEAKTEPKKQLVAHVKTGDIDSDTPNHTGVWALYVKGKSMTDAIRDAVRDAGAEGMAIGGRLTVTLLGDEPVPGKRFRRNLFSASYTPPADASATFIAGDDPAPVGVLATTWAALSPDGKARMRAALDKPAANDEPPF